MKHTFLFLTIFLSLGFFSCRKDIVYPEGGNSHNVTDKINGYWTLAQYTVNGLDSLGNLDKRIIVPGAINFYGTRYHYLRIEGIPNQACPLFFGNDCRILKFSISSGVPQFYQPFTIGTWEILECNNHVLKLRKETDKEYVMVLK